MTTDIVDGNQKINGHSITVGWLLESLRENDKVFQKLHGNRSVKEISFFNVGEGKGFWSEILRCTLIFTDSNDSSDVYTTILKIPGFDALVKADLHSHEGDDNKKDEIIKRVNDVHYLECEFYNNLAPILGIPVPKCFKTQEWISRKQDGCIHMEDLTGKGKCLLFFETINLTQVKCFIRHLAHMHKNILSADPKIWQGKYLKNQENHVNVVDMMKPLVEPFLKKSKREDAIRPILEKYGKFFESKDFIRYASAQSYKDQGLTPILVHGDMHGGNIMWAIDEEGNLQNDIAAFVDWQVIHEGSPMSDLAQFLAFCCDGVVRRQAEEFAIDYYLECLTKEFSGDSGKVPYTREQLKKSYNYLFMTKVFMMGPGAMFLFTALDSREPNQTLKDAYFDASVLKAIHASEDAAKLLNGEMKDVFEKYGAQFVYF